MTQDAPTPKSNRWTTRDVLTFVVFNLIIMAVTIVAKMIEDMVLAPQNTFFVGSWLFPLLATPFYVVMADRIGKRGVLAGSTGCSTRSWEGSTALPSPSWAPLSESSSCGGRIPTTT